MALLFEFRISAPGFHRGTILGKPGGTPCWMLSLGFVSIVCVPLAAALAYEEIVSRSLTVSELILENEAKVRMKVEGLYDEAREHEKGLLQDSIQWSNDARDEAHERRLKAEAQAQDLRVTVRTLTQELARALTEGGKPPAQSEKAPGAPGADSKLEATL